MDRLDPAQTVTLSVSFFQIIRRLTSFDPLEDWFPASVGVFLGCHVSSLSTDPVSLCTLSFFFGLSPSLSNVSRGAISCLSALEFPLASYLFDDLITERCRDAANYSEKIHSRKNVKCGLHAKAIVRLHFHSPSGPCLPALPIRGPLGQCSVSGF